MIKFLRGIQTYLRHTDLFLLLLALLCSGLGLVAIYSATYTMDSDRYIVIQSVAICLGTLCFIIASLIDFENISRFWKWFFLLNVLFQLAIIPLGHAGDTGNRSWIQIAPGLNVQPAEFGKLIFIFTMACHMNQLKDKINRVTSVGQLIVHFAVILAVVFIPTRDLGRAVAYTLIFVVMLFASGLNWKWLGGMTAAGLACVPLVWAFLDTYQKNRILVIFDPEIDPARYYQTEQSKIAIGSGQFLGSGYLQGRQTQHNSLPAKHTDSIFSVIGEEFGFVGCCVVLVLLTILVLRLFYDAGRCDGRFGYLVCIGIGSMFMVQTIINVGMCVGVLPVIGLTLPFFSYGGTSLVALFGALGIAASFILRQRPAWLRSRDDEEASV